MTEHAQLKIPCKAGELIITDDIIRVESSQPRFGWTLPRAEVAGMSSRKTPLGLLRDFDQELIVQTRDGRELRADWLTSDQVLRVADLLSADQAGAPAQEHAQFAATGTAHAPVDIAGVEGVLSIAPDTVRLTGRWRWTIPRSAVTGASSQTGPLASDLIVHTRDGGEWSAPGISLTGAVRAIEELGYVPAKHHVARAAPANLFCREGMLVVTDDRVSLNGRAEQSLQRAEIDAVTCHVETPTRSNLLITARDGRTLQASALAPANALLALELLSVAPDTDERQPQAPAPLPAWVAPTVAGPAAEVAPPPIAPASTAAPLATAAQTAPAEAAETAPPMVPTPAQSAITQPLRPRRPTSRTGPNSPRSAARATPSPAGRPSDATTEPAPSPRVRAMSMFAQGAETAAPKVARPSAARTLEAIWLRIGPYRRTWQPITAAGALLILLVMLYVGVSAALGGGGTPAAAPTHTALPSVAAPTHAAPPAATLPHATLPPAVRTPAAPPVAYPTAEHGRTPTSLPVRAAVALTFTCARAVDYSYARLCVHTQPGAALTISVKYCAGFSQPDPGRTLQGTAYADASGSYVWGWTPQTTCHNTALAYVTVNWHGQMGYYSYSFTVQ